MSGSIGTAVALTLFGESHGPMVGAVLDGLAPGIPVDEAALAREMDRRRASGALATARQEADVVELAAGVYRGRTTGAPVCLLVRNTAAQSGDYPPELRLPRPGHADYTAHVKYGGYADHRGGGRFSGRLTAPLVAAGALCRQVLAGHGVLLGTHLASCAGVQDAPLPQREEPLWQALQALNERGFSVLDEEAGEEMRAAILRAKRDGDSVGGILETAVAGLPAGVGEPFFHSVESVLAALYFSIPGVKGVEFGLGFGFAARPGSQVADPLVMEDGAVRTQTNHNGGVNGGITNGMPLVARLAVKPTPSIAAPLQTVDLALGTAATLRTEGRHDPCIAPRARAVADAVTALGLLDLLTQQFGRAWQAGGEGPVPGGAGR